MIDIELVQKLIEKEIHPDFTIAEYYDTPLYVFISWKHKDYYKDEERSSLLGPGLIVFDKKKNEYRVMGSAESWYVDYLDSNLFPDEERKRDIINNALAGNQTNDSDKTWIVGKITKDILRRNHINSDDIQDLCIITGARPNALTEEEEFEMKWMPGLKRNDHNLVIFDNKDAHNNLIQIWDEIGFKYEIISDTKLLLWKVKSARNIGD
jgi:hypothetical protein